MSRRRRSSPRRSVGARSWRLRRSLTRRSRITSPVELSKTYWRYAYLSGCERETIRSWWVTAVLAGRTSIPSSGPHRMLVKQRQGARVVPTAARVAIPEFPLSWTRGHLAGSARKVTKQARLLQALQGPSAREEMRLEVLGDHDARPGRHRLDLFHEHLHFAQAGVLGRAVGQGLLVPVGREHQARPVEGAHEPARVVVNLEPLSCRGDQRDVRPEPLDLPLEVVHGTEPEDLVSGKAQHVGE